MQPHDHGHRSVYHATCERCRILDLARSPDVHVRRAMKAVREEAGREAMRALAAAVQAQRQEAKA